MCVKVSKYIYWVKKKDLIWACFERCDSTEDIKKSNQLIKITLTINLQCFPYTRCLPIVVVFITADKKFFKILKINFAIVVHVHGFKN